jgi:hypothetical protein
MFKLGKNFATGKSSNPMKKNVLPKRDLAENPPPVSQNDGHIVRAPLPNYQFLASGFTWKYSTVYCM